MIGQIRIGQIRIFSEKKNPCCFFEISLFYQYFYGIRGSVFLWGRCLSFSTQVAYLFFHDMRYPHYARVHGGLCKAIFELCAS